MRSDHLGGLQYKVAHTLGERSNRSKGSKVITKPKSPDPPPANMDTAVGTKDPDESIQTESMSTTSSFHEGDLSAITQPGISVPPDIVPSGETHTNFYQ